MKLFVLHSFTFQLILCPRVVLGKKHSVMPAVADVYCAHTCVCIGQPSRTDAFSTSLLVLLCVGVCAFHSPLVIFSSLHPTWPSSAKVTLKVDMSLRCLWEWRRQEGTDDVISEASSLSQERRCTRFLWMVLGVSPVIISSSLMAGHATFPLWEAC